MTGSAPLDRSGGASYSIPDLVSLASEGAIRVPTFQRQYVWGSKEVRDLFDSLYRGFPVGTLLLWRRAAPAGAVSLGPISLEVPANPNALWVVDGQQRITSLFGVLSPNHAGADDRFELYFDLASQRFVNPRRGAVVPRSIPVREALETRTLLNWLRRHTDDLEPDDFDLADRLGGSLRDYRIPAYIVAGDDQALLREVFDRVNSAGKPISRAQVFHALFAQDDQPSSPASVARELRPLGFGDIDESRIVQSVLAIRGGDVQRDIHDEFQAHEDPTDWYDQAQQALARSISFLRDEGVYHQLLMPNTLPIPVLAAFFHVHPEPSPWTLRLLARWIWRGWVHGFGREGGQTPTLRRAIRSINPEHRRPDGAPSEFDAVRALLEYTPDRGTPRLSLLDFKTNFANSRLILLAIASLNPRASTGELIDIGAELEEHGVDAITEFVQGHRTNAASRGLWRVGDPARAKDVRDSEVLQSHGISPVASHALANGDASVFLQSRTEYLQELVFGFLDNRMEPRALLRPSLEDLALTGAADGGQES